MVVATTILVGMAETKTAKGPATFACLGLGSCIGIAILDPIAKVAGMVHVMLPEAFADRPIEKPGKFADTGVPHLISELEKLGAMKSRMKIAISGGAQVFKFGDGTASRMDIGNRNSTAVLAQLKSLGLHVVAQDIGGHNGRTMTFDSSTGEIRVKTVAQGEAQLCILR